ncbi:hypothetical protein [Streptomyces sp. ISL-66]|uniref:hypothetical protein n=1 Tax=Streptomyces sp. ISL-66 TaxID=2819186 RepID=UPI0020353C49|nr:hypothetical protein [Streptomyces sp. ISL-66]
MNWTKNLLPRRSILSVLTARPWRELYAWVLAGLLVDAVARCGGNGFDPGSVWDMALGCAALGAIRTGLLRGFAVVARED